MNVPTDVRVTKEGWVIGAPSPMRDVKQEARRSVSPTRNASPIAATSVSTGDADYDAHMRRNEELRLKRLKAQ